MTDKRRVVIVAIDGAIAVGKSTMCGSLRDLGYDVRTEGADDDERWAGPLRRFYAEPRRWGLMLQCAILADMAALRRDLLCAADGTGGGPAIVFVERSPASARIFVRNSVALGHMDALESTVYDRLHAELGWNPDYVVHLHLPPDEAIARMRSRARDSEADVDGAYVRRVSGLYTGFVSEWKRRIRRGEMEPTRRIYEVDASPGPSRVLSAVLAVVDDIRLRESRIIKKA